MTLAPDLPLPVRPEPVPDPSAAERPALALVPATSAPDEPIVDFDQALRVAQPRLQRYAVRRLLDPHEAEEVVQEAMLRAFTHRETLRTEDDLMAWLTVVTGRLVIDRLRVRGRMTPVAELPGGTRAVRDTAEVVVARDEARIALDALEAMPTRQAAVLWAREVEGLSYDEIGERYELSEPTVRSLLHRARKTLRREYAVRGGSLPTAGLVALAPWLRGLHIAGRLRHAARKTTGAAAVTATGLAVATLAPFWSHSAPAQAHAATRQPLIKAESHTTDLPAQHTTSATRTTERPSTATHDTTILSRLPRSCMSGSTVTAGCSRPTASTFFLATPMRQLGISTDLLHLNCNSLPTNNVTHCQPSDRKS